MSPSIRKLVGGIALVFLVIVYAVLATTIAVARLSDSSAWVHLVYFLVTGVLWIVPAMGIISWMMRAPRNQA